MNKKHLTELFLKSINSDYSQNFSIDNEFGSIMAQYEIYGDDEEDYDVFLGRMMLFSESNIELAYNDLENLGQKHFGIFYKMVFFQSDTDATHFEIELTSEEFVKFLLMFKKRKKKEDKKVEKCANEYCEPDMEMLSDIFGLDFFPRRRRLLIEKVSIRRGLEF